MTVCLVLSLVIRNQVVKRHPVVGNDVVDAVEGTAGFFDAVREEIVTTIQSSHHRRDKAEVSPDKAANIISKLTVPLVPEHAREAGAELISPACIPRFRDQTSSA